jgi:NAD(P)-dependent dehydrogenase (short-subunit alcohol dehydrogenase family)
MDHRTVARGFDGRVVLVTGAGSGIGAVTAARFAAEGATVLVSDIDGAAAARVAAGIPRAVPITLDVTDAAGVRSVTGEARARFGTIDVLVNNAAIASDTPLESLTGPEWSRELEVVLTGPFLMSQAVISAMTAAGGGAIVNVSSVNAVGYFGNDAYSAAKAGLLSLTRSVAVRHGPAGIRCNAVLPGTVRTPAWDERERTDPGVLDRVAGWYPLGRVGAPEDIAAAILFLAGDDAAWITGVCLPVDGGLLAGNRRMTDDITGADGRVGGDGAGVGDGAGDGAGDGGAVR